MYMCFLIEIENNFSSGFPLSRQLQKKPDDGYACLHLKICLLSDFSWKQGKNDQKIKFLVADVVGVISNFVSD